LTARAVGEFRDRIRTVGVTVATARKILATLHAVLEYAISQDWVATNAAHGIKVIGPRGEGSQKIVPPSKEDVRRVIDAAGEELRLMVIFAASTGARAGEQWAIRWQDVNFDKRELRIKRRVDAYGEEGAPKSTDGVRTVPLSAQLVSALKAWKLKSRFSKPEDLIFPNRRGADIGHDNLIKRDVAGAKRFNWHSLRHFAVSGWIEAGMAPKTVQTLQVMPRCKSRWIATDTYFQTRTTRGRWTRSPRSYSRGFLFERPFKSEFTIGVHNRTIFVDLLPMQRACFQAANATLQKTRSA
jgi:integrase